MQIIFIEAGIEHVCNISNRNFQKFPLAFRAGQFVDDTFYYRQFDLYNVNVESIHIDYGSHQSQRTGLTLGSYIYITMTLLPKNGEPG